MFCVLNLNPTHRFCSGVDYSKLKCLLTIQHSSSTQEIKSLFYPLYLTFKAEASTDCQMQNELTMPIVLSQKNTSGNTWVLGQIQQPKTVKSHSIC